MKLPVFKQLLSKIKKADETVNFLYKYVDLTNVTDEYISIISLLMEHYYGEEGAEWIDWFLYEKQGREDMTATDKDGNEICRNEEELWVLCEELRAVKGEYKEKIPMTEEESKKLLEEMAIAFKKGSF
jgi:hypothetical protein